MKPSFSGQYYVLGITGGTGSGKTEFARQLQGHLPGQTVLLSQDWYYFDRSGLNEEELLKLNFDHPDAIEHSLLLHHLEQLCCGKTVETPRYDFASHRRLPETVRTDPARIIIVEGLFVLQQVNLRHLLDDSIFIDVPADVRLVRRLRRDLLTRHNLEDTLRIYEDRVRPMHEQYVQPGTNLASLIWKPLSDSTFPDQLTERLREICDAH